MADELSIQEELSTAVALPATDPLTLTELLGDTLPVTDAVTLTELLGDTLPTVDALTLTELLADTLASPVVYALPLADELPSHEELSTAVALPATDALTLTELLADTLFDTVVYALSEGDTVTLTEPFPLNDILELPD